MDRKAGIIRTSIIAIAANLILVISKATVGFLSHSIAIVMDAVNNLSDALSSIITIVGTKLANKKPDKDHPYGHGRIEYLTSLIISLIVLLAGVSSLRESIEKIIHPVEPAYRTVTFLIVVTGIITKLLLGRFVSSQGNKFHSEALVASGKDASFDAVITTSTLISALIFVITRINLEGWLGTAISLIIIKTGVEIMMDSLSYIIGKRVDSTLSQELKNTINSYPEVKGTYDMILHNYGPDNYIGSCHIEVDDSLTALELHRLTQKITTRIYQEFGIILTIGIYASNEYDELASEIKKDLYVQIEHHPEILQMHGFYLDKENQILSLDLVMDYETLNPKELRNHIAQYFRDKYGLTVNINIDNDFGD